MKLWMILMILFITLAVDIAILILWKVKTRKTRLFGFLNYKELSNNSNLNIFGIIFIGTILNILFTPISIFYWMYKLCTWHPGVEKDNYNDRTW